MDRNYDPLHYVLLFLRGEPGWHPNLLHFRGTKTVTQQQYYSYRLMVRTDNFPPLHHSGRLTQEYVVDCFCKIEGGQRFNVLYLIINDRQIVLASPLEFFA